MLLDSADQLRYGEDPRGTANKTSVRGGPRGPQRPVERLERSRGVFWDVCVDVPHQFWRTLSLVTIVYTLH